MANEAVIVNLGPNGGNPIKFTVADGTNISKGTLLKLSGDRTVAASAANSDVFAGIAAADKEANDGATKLSAYTEGIFDLVACTAGVTLGGIVSISLANIIKQATEAEMVTGDIVGKCIETASDGETVQVMLGVI